MLGVLAGTGEEEEEEEEEEGWGFETAPALSAKNEIVRKIIVRS